MKTDTCVLSIFPGTQSHLIACANTCTQARTNSFLFLRKPLVAKNSSHIIGLALFNKYKSSTHQFRRCHLSKQKINTAQLPKKLAKDTVFCHSPLFSNTKTISGSFRLYQTKKKSLNLKKEMGILFYAIQHSNLNVSL